MTQPPQITITQNGFTPEFEAKVLHSAIAKGKAMSTKAFLKSLQ